MPTKDPRVRALLTQADRTAANGKMVAAESLYRQILADAPETEEAWLGLAGVVNDPAERRAAYERVLAMSPGNPAAQEGIDRLDGKLPPVVEAEPAVATAPVVAVAVAEEVAAAEPVAVPANGGRPAPAYTPLKPDVYEAPCYRHADRMTALRCYNCGNPICGECARKTPVGYICPDCQRQAEDAFFNSKPTDYLIAAAVSFPISLLVGFIISALSSSFFFYIIIFFVSGAVGTFIGRIAKRAIGFRRGRYLPGLVVAMMVLGVLVPFLGVFLAILAGNVGALLALIGPGIYLFVASSAAYWQMR